MDFQKSVSLQSKHTFGLPWETDFFYEIKSESEAKEVLGKAQNLDLSVLILGGGSNILPTKPYKGLVLQNKIIGKKVISENNDSVMLKIGGGENWHEVVLWTLENNFYGLENLSLIPGTVGGAVVQNIGAYDVEISKCIDSVEAYNIESGEKQSFSPTECEFAYRNSFFKKTDTWFVTAVTLKLPKVFTPVLTYNALGHLRSVEGLTAKQVSATVVHVRESKLPHWHKVGTAGSFFANPRASKENVTRLQKNYPDIPIFHNYDSKEATIPAGWLIEHSSLSETKRKDFLYEKHNLIVINKYKHKETPEQWAQQIHLFIGEIQKTIEKDFGITLSPEVRIF